MLLNELHQGGIRAIIDYDGTVFNNMTLPTGVSLADVVDHILYKYGDAPLFSPDPHVLKFYFGRWSSRRLPLWERYKNAIELEYNPIENYDRQEDVTFTHGKKVTYAGTETNGISGGYTDATSGNIKVETDDTTTNEISADNANTYQPDNKSTLDGEQNTSFTNYQEQRTYNNYQATRGFTNRTDTNSGDDVTSGRIHGNIGVTTSQQMLTSELDLIPRLDLIDFIADDWHDEFCLKIY